MSNPNTPEPQAQGEPEITESFGEIFSEYEKSQSAKPRVGGQAREATVITVTAESVFLDIGFKTEGVLPISALGQDSAKVKPGDKLLVTVKGRNEEGYYEVSRGRVERPTDWAALEKAFTEKTAIAGTVTAQVKGGFSVDVGVRAFMPASRSGVRDAADMEKLVGQEIRCRITKLDVGEEDVVVDRRVIAEEEEAAARTRRYGELKEGDVVRGTVRSMVDYGAFIDIGGIDALLHVGEISWQRVNKPSDVLSVGQEIEAKVLKIEAAKKRISLSAKQLLPHPWDVVPGKYKTGERVRGVVTRLMDFGAFVEIEPGIEGLIHISEMSWAKRVRSAADVVKKGDTVEAVILGVNVAERRISLGLKQALGDPWADVAQKYPAGAVIEGPVTNITKFGAFVQLAEGVEGMIHVSEISAEKRINHPQDVLRVGQVVKAQVLEVDREKRSMRLSMKQLVPTDLDGFLAEQKEGDVVSGRIVEISGANAQVELGEGIFASCAISKPSTGAADTSEAKAPAKADLSSLTSMLQARWKSGAAESSAKPEDLRPGQIRKFSIVKLDRESKKIELKLA